MEYLENSFMSKKNKLILKTLYPRKIVKLYVGRVPVQKVLSFLMNIMSAGKLKRALENSEHDDLFHLFLIVGLDNGGAVRFERNERFEISKYKYNDGEVALEIPTVNLTVGELFENYRRKLGSWNNILYYNPITSNCQHFVLGLLENSVQINDTQRNFILQNTETLLKNMPATRKLINHITLLGLAINIKINGSGNKIVVKYIG